MASLHKLCVSLVPIFNHLPQNELIKIASKAAMRTVKRGEFIHRAGDHSDQLFILHQGKVKVYRLSEGGKEQLVRILQPGDFTGELAQRLGTSEKQTAVIGTEPIDTRIGLYLASLVEKSNTPNIILPMSRKHLASFLGTIPETISRRLAAFEEEGWIAQTGQRNIRVVDLDACVGNQRA